MPWRNLFIAFYEETKSQGYTFKRNDHPVRYENIDVMFGEKVSIERGQESIIIGPVSQDAPEANLENASRENEIRNVKNENMTPRPDRLLK